MADAFEITPQEILCTTQWYAHYTFKTQDAYISFQNLIDDYVAECVYPHAKHLLFPNNAMGDLTDLMYVLLDPLWLSKGLGQRMWALGIARLICKTYGFLSFSKLEYKYIYMELMYENVHEVDLLLKARCAKKNLAMTFGCLAASYATYKMVQPVILTIISWARLT